MGILEPNLRNTHWLPVVKQAVLTKEYPGYRYEMFSSWAALDEYLKSQCGKDWQIQPWADFWLNQHKQTQNDDYREYLIMSGAIVPQVDRIRKPRTNHDVIKETILNIYKKYNRFLSVRSMQKQFYKLGIKTSHMTISRVLKELKKELKDA